MQQAQIASGRQCVGETSRFDPGTSYHDPVHTWCGAIFTGTFEFRVDICTLPSYIPVNCGA